MKTTQGTTKSKDPKTQDHTRLIGRMGRRKVILSGPEAAIFMILLLIDPSVARGGVSLTLMV